MRHLMSRDRNPIQGRFRPAGGSRRGGDALRVVIIACTLGFVVLVMVAVLQIRSGMLRLWNDVMKGAGPGKSDYSVEICNGFHLGRSSLYHRGITGPERQLIDPAKRSYLTNSWVDNDVTRVGWDDRFIVCYQHGSPDAEEPTSGWWIIDTIARQRYGPYDEQAYRSKLKELNLHEAIPVAPTPAWSGGEVEALFRWHSAADAARRDSSGAGSERRPTSADAGG
jgi:hypothetical protein